LADGPTLAPRIIVFDSLADGSTLEPIGLAPRFNQSVSTTAVMPGPTVKSSRLVARWAATRKCVFRMLPFPTT